MTEYHTLLVSGFVRILVGCVALFGLVPRLALPAVYSGEPWRRRAANFLTAGALAVVSAHLLVLVGMYDGVVLATICLGLWSVRIWYSGSRESSNGIRNLSASLLRKLDVVSWTRWKESGRRWLRTLAERTDPFRVLSLLILALVLAATGLIRLLPAWYHAAPFSVEYYETLEQVKRLQINQMYIQGFGTPLGLPMIAQTLGLLSQVNVAIILHFLGALSSVLLGSSIAYVVYRATFSIQGAIIGAAVFGLFNQLLPMDMRHQVEADSIVLACAFMLPSISFLAEYCIDLRPRTLAVALTGLLCTASINLFVGIFALAASFIVLIGALLFAFRNPALRGARLFAMLAVVVVVPAAFYFLVGTALNYDSFKNTLQVLLYDQHVNRYVSLNDDLPQLFLWSSAVLFGVSVVLGVWRFSNNFFHLQLFSWGAIGIALLLLARYGSDELAVLIPSSQIDFLLSILGAIAAGFSIGWGTRFGAALFQRFHAGKVVGDVWRLIVVVGALVVLSFCSPMQNVIFDYTAEPDGFAKSMYLIEQKFMPYQWTVVSHRGTALSGMNRGRFLDYGYFYSRYNPETYRHGSKESVPTPVLFIFVERARERTDIATELATVSSSAAENIKVWLDSYQKNHYDLRIFYSDEEVVVYELEDPAVNALRG
jgi:hypothetical protein